MNIDNLIKANDVLHTLERTAELLQRVASASSLDHIYWELPRDDDVRDAARDALRRIIDNHCLVKITHLKALLAELGVPVTDKEIIDRAKAAETARQQRQAEYAERQKEKA